MSKEVENIENNDDGVYEFYRDVVAKSDEGKILKDKIRWERYFLKKNDNGEWEKIISDEKLQKILGNDANNLGHMRFSYLTGDLLVNLQNKIYPENGFTDRDKLKLKISDAVHDLGEAKSGDKSFDLKTENDEEEELKEMFLILDKVLKDNEFGVEKEEIMEILVNKESRLGKVFNVRESINYFRTGIIAWIKSNRIKNKELTSSLKWLSSNVLGNNIKKLIGLYKEYALVEYFIDFYRDDISEAFEEMPRNIFKHYEDKKKKKENIKKYREAKKSWKKFEKETEIKESSILAFNRMPSQR